MNASVLVAPDGFKAVLDAPAVARAIAVGLRRAQPEAEVVLAPMADGGEGTRDVLVQAAGGQLRRVCASGPLGAPVEITVGLIHGAAAAVIELASVAGYALIEEGKRDPLRTTTYGLGQVIRATLEAGIEEIILGLGDSATVDGGAGMMQALGMTFLDAEGRACAAPMSGGRLLDIDRIVWDGPPETLAHVRLTLACDVLNPACGPDGAASVFAPQKGADAAAVAQLERGLSHWADLLEAEAHRAVRDEPGTGAAGGTALPLIALLGATIVPGVDLVCEANDLPNRIGGADLVVTGEGRLDRQSLMGKVVGTVGRLSRAAEVPCVAIVGAAGDEAPSCLTVLERFYTLDCPLDQTERALAAVAESVARDWL